MSLIITYIHYDHFYRLCPPPLLRAARTVLDQRLTDYQKPVFLQKFSNWFMMTRAIASVVGLGCSISYKPWSVCLFQKIEQMT